MRNFDFITIGRILLDLKTGRGGHDMLPNLSRSTLVRLERKFGIYDPNRRGVGKWGIYSPEEAEDLKNEVRKYYKKN